MSFSSSDFVQQVTGEAERLGLIPGFAELDGEELAAAQLFSVVELLRELDRRIGGRQREELLLRIDEEARQCELF